jgi:hypothetical protein
MTTALMTGSDVTVIVTARFLKLWLEQWCKRLAFMEVRIDHLDH